MGLHRNGYWYCNCTLYADSLIKQLEGSVDEYKGRLICVNSTLQSMEQELKLKDDACISLKENLASAEKEKNNLELRNQDCNLEIAKLCMNNNNLNDLLNSFVDKITELDKEHASMSSHVFQLLSSFDRFQGMVKEEKMLIERSSKEKFEDLQNRFVELTSENSGLKIEIEEMKSRIIELQKTQEIVIVQHVEECQVAEDKIRKLESEAEISASNINRFEKLASGLHVRIQKLLEDFALGQNHQVCQLLGPVTKIIAI
jgi:chromosome segregation ATPase